MTKALPRSRSRGTNPVRALATNMCCFAGRMTSLEGRGGPCHGIWLPWAPGQLSVASALAAYGSWLRGPALRLQFLLQLVEEAPVRALRNDLVRARLDHPNLLQAQTVEA